MSRYIPGNQKHLTLEDRKYIKKSLNEGLAFKEIARYLCKCRQYRWYWNRGKRRPCGKHC